MSRTIINFWLDALLLVLFLTLCEVSAIVRFVFPSAPEASGGTLWGGDYFAWREFQFGVLCAMAVAVLLHLMLHWNWICTVFARNVAGRKPDYDEGIRTLYGVALLILTLTALGGLLIAAKLSLSPGAIHPKSGQFSVR